MCSRRKLNPYCEIELLRLLLVGPSLGDARFAHERFRDGGFNGLHGVAVLETVGNVKILDRDDVLDRLQRRFHRLLNLPGENESTRKTKYIASKSRGAKHPRASY